MIKLFLEFKPALTFLGKFLAAYFIGNLLYGLYIESHPNQPDFATRTLAVQASGILRSMGYDATFENVPGAPKVSINEGTREILHVFEGCNGLNVSIVFLAFLFAFGGPAKVLAFFIPCGLLIIHLFNLLRISLLYHLALTSPGQFYYYHKYFFTAILYLVVFGLWALWITRFNGSSINRKATA